MSADEQAHKQDLLKVFRKNLQLLEIQAAQHGLDIPLKILNEIDYHKAKIQEIELSIQEQTDDGTTTFAGITLCQAISTVFVDIMRMFYAISSEISFRANFARYSEFIRKSEHHLDDLRVLFAPFTTARDIHTQGQSIFINRRLSWMIVRLASESNLTLHGDEYLGVMRELSPKIETFYLHVAKEYFEKQHDFVEAIVKRRFPDVYRGVYRSYNDLFMLRQRVQTAVSEQYSRHTGVRGGIAYDIDQSLYVLYFLVDHIILQNI